MSTLDKFIPSLSYHNNQHRVISAMWYCGVLLDELVIKLVAPHDISLEEFRMMRVLLGLKPEAIPVYNISHYVPVRSDVSRAITRLSGKGYLIKMASPNDKRVTLVTITPTGEKLMNEIINQYHGVILAENILTDQEAVETLKQVEKVTATLRNLIDRYKTGGGGGGTGSTGPNAR